MSPDENKPKPPKKSGGKKSPSKKSATKSASATSEVKADKPKKTSTTKATKQLASKKSSSKASKSTKTTSRATKATKPRSKATKPVEAIEQEVAAKQADAAPIKEAEPKQAQAQEAPKPAESKLKSADIETKPAETKPSEPKKETAVAASAPKEEASKSKSQGKIGRAWCALKTFAKVNTSLFVLICIVILVFLNFITYQALHMTSTTEFCGTCHSPDYSTGPGAEYHTWKKTSHAMVGVGCIDCHSKPGIVGYMRAKIGGLWDVVMELTLTKEQKLAKLNKALDIEYASKLVPNDNCLICHSDDDNERIRSERPMTFFGFETNISSVVKNPSFRKQFPVADIYNEDMPKVGFSHYNHVQTLGISCVNCHQGVAHRGELHTKPSMNTCFKCHDSKRKENPALSMPKNSDCATCHTRTVVQHDGTLLKDAHKVGSFFKDKPVPTTPPSMMADAGIYGPEGCSNCHESAFKRPTRNTCNERCHGTDEENKPISYADVFDSIRKEYDAKKKPLDKMNNKLYSELKHMTFEQQQKFNEFKYYYDIIYRDRSKGIHNNDLSEIAFQRADEIANSLADDLNIRFED